MTVSLESASAALLNVLIEVKVSNSSAGVDGMADLLALDLARVLGPLSGV